MMYNSNYPFRVSKNSETENKDENIEKNLSFFNRPSKNIWNQINNLQKAVFFEIRHISISFFFFSVYL